MRHSVKILSCAPVTYPFEGAKVTGTNVLAEVDGKRSSSRLPWITGPQEAHAHLLRTLMRTAPKR